MTLIPVELISERLYHLGFKLRCDGAIGMGFESYISWPVTGDDALVRIEMLPDDFAADDEFALREGALQMEVVALFSA
jgi:hypothetical protein